MSYENQQFDSFEEWANKASSWLTRYEDNPDGSDPSWMDEGERERTGYRAICFDRLGRPCAMGAHFMRARDEGAFPVRWLWPHQIAQDETWGRRRRKAALEEIVTWIGVLDPHIPDDNETLVRLINKIEDVAQEALSKAEGGE